MSDDIIKPVPQLKPCPFCGGEASVVNYKGSCSVMCRSCHASSTNVGSERLAAQLWNNRALDQYAIQQMIVDKLAEAYRAQVQATGRSHEKADGIYDAITIVADMVLTGRREP